MREGLLFFAGCMFMMGQIHMNNHVLGEQSWHCTAERVTADTLPREMECVKYEKGGR